MTRNKKVIERHQLELFLKHAPLSFNFDEVTIQENEAPDFILLLPDGKVVGVELTMVFWEPKPGTPPPQAIHATYDKIAEIAQRKYEEEGGPPVAVFLFFQSSFMPSKRDVIPVADAIAAYIREHLPDEGEEFKERLSWTNYDRFPEHISSIHIWRGPRLTQSFFSVPKTAFLPALTRKHVGRILEEKEQKLPAYRQRCPRCEEMWLVMVCNLEMSTQFDLDESLLTAPFPSAFDRVFIYCLMDQQVYELPLETKRLSQPLSRE